MDYTDYDTRLAAYAVIERDGQVLLARWNEPDPPRWTLPGGGVELDETVEEAAVREVLEETGYDVELTGLLGVRTQTSAPRPGRERWLKHVQVAFAARVTGGELRAEVGGTTDEARWFAAAEVPSLHRSGNVRGFVG